MTLDDIIQLMIMSYRRGFEDAALTLEKAKEVVTDKNLDEMFRNAIVSEEEKKS